MASNVVRGSSGGDFAGRGREKRDCEKGSFAGAEAVTVVCDGARVGSVLASEKAWLRLRFSGTQVLAER